VQPLDEKGDAPNFFAVEVTVDRTRCGSLQRCPDLAAIKKISDRQISDRQLSSLHGNSSPFFNAAIEERKQCV